MEDAKYLSSKELASLKLNSLPKTPTGIRMRADAENWEYRRRQKSGGGIEYAVEKLPYKVKKEILEKGVLEKDVVKLENHCSHPSIVDEFEFIKGYNIQASAGFGTLNWESENPSRYLAFRKKWLKFKGFSANNLMALFTKGDSMLPTIDNNDTILVNTASKSLNDGKIYVIRLGEQILVKRLQGLANGVRLISDNKIYDSLDLVNSDLENLEVIGEVVHVAHDL